MTDRKTLVACLLLAAALAALPTASAANRTTIAGASGTPVNPACAPDGEVMTNLGGTMFFPHAGCSASYDPSSSGVADGVALTAVQVTYQVTGHVGTICGHFSFSGRITGSQPEACTAHDAIVTVEFVGTSSGDPYADVVLTWHPTTEAWDNAYLASFVVQGGSSPLPPGSCQPQGNVGAAMAFLERTVRLAGQSPIFEPTFSCGLDDPILKVRRD